MSWSNTGWQFPMPPARLAKRIPQIRRGWLVGLFLMLAFAFQGSRALWEPDEGRYTNVALNMLESGDWMNPRRNDDVGHWTKPPVTYWTIAASVSVLGRTPWAARLPMALSYLACIWLAWRLARRLAPGTERQAAVAYATMLLPFGAAQLVTTDFVMTALQTTAMLAFVEARFGDQRFSRRWLAGMWIGFAFAFMTKGPPALLPLLAIAAFELLVPLPPKRSPVFSFANLSIFLLLAMPWYVAVSRHNPGLLDYLIGSEVVARIATDHFKRHGEWYGWIEIYLPTLLIGTLPWSASLWRWLKRHVPAMARWRQRATRPQEAASIFLMLWIVLPLLVLCLARSRLPLYILPLFVPFALLVAQQWRDDPARAPSSSKLFAWACILLLLKAGAAHWPTHKNAADWAQAIRERVSHDVKEVVFVEDMARYGLNLHMGAQVEKVSIHEISLPPFNSEYDGYLDAELSGTDSDELFVTKEAQWLAIRTHIEQRGLRVKTHGTPFHDRVFFSVHDDHGDPSVHLSQAEEGAKVKQRLSVEGFAKPIAAD